MMTGMSHLYGDSTAFPYTVDFLDLVRAAVECSVALMQAQGAVAQAVEKARSLQAETEVERNKLKAFEETLEQALSGVRAEASDRVFGIVARLKEASRKSVASEIEALEKRAYEGVAAARSDAALLRDETVRALERFLQRYEIPGTTVGLRLTAAEETYTGEARMVTPFGVEALFALAIPAESQWSRLRRVGDLLKDFELQVPKEVGLFSKTTRLVAQRMDKLVVLQVEHSAGRFWMRMGARGVAGFAVEVVTKEGVQYRLLAVDESGRPTSAPMKLEAADATAVDRIHEAVVASFSALATERKAMSGATFEGKPLRDLHEPQAVVARVVGLLAPIVQEIDRRSGSQGELVLRRDLAQGHRDEVYLTKAELNDRIQTLPDPLQKVFDPLGLAGAPRSARAPAPSAPPSPPAPPILTPSPAAT
jgi:hypothetical protein